MNSDFAPCQSQRFVYKNRLSQISRVNISLLLYNIPLGYTYISNFPVGRCVCLHVEVALVMSTQHLCCPSHNRLTPWPRSWACAQDMPLLVALLCPE